MRLEALELVVRRQMRILVVEMDDEADGDQVVVEVIEERAAAGVRLSSGQPWLCMTSPLLVLLRRDLPQLLDADAVLLRIDAVAQVELAASAPATASRGSLRRTACTSRAAPCRAGSRGLCVPSRATPMSPVATPRTAPLSSNSTSAAAKPGIDLHAQRFGLLREPAAHVAEAHDVVAVVVHQRRQQPVRACGYALSARQDQEPVLGHRRRRCGAPRAFQSGMSSFSALRIDDRAGQDVRADLRALLEHAHRDFAAAARRRAASGGSPRRGPPGRRRRSTTSYSMASRVMACRLECRGTDECGEGSRSLIIIAGVRLRRDPSMTAPRLLVHTSRSAASLGRHGRARPRQQRRLLPLHGAGAHRMAVRASVGRRLRRRATGR